MRVPHRLVREDLEPEFLRALGLAIYYQRTPVRESEKPLVAKAQEQMKLHFGRHRAPLKPRM